jgi:hypothetical protein
MKNPEVKRLSSGYWLVRWSGEIWAQWPCGREPVEADFFHAETTYTAERLRQCRERTQGTSA